MIKFATEAIERMDAANEKRKETVSKKAKENEPILQKIYEEILNDEPKTATDVSEVLEVSVQKASALLRVLVKEDKAKSEDIKVAKKGTQKGYTKI